VEGAEAGQTREGWSTRLGTGLGRSGAQVCQDSIAGGLGVFERRAQGWVVRTRGDVHGRHDLARADDEEVGLEHDQPSTAPFARVVSSDGRLTICEGAEPQKRQGNDISTTA
jgi:hypothetical protein